VSAESSTASDGKKQCLVTAVFSRTPKPGGWSSSADKKYILARQLALMCCRDLLPFNIVEKPGFTTFLLQNKVVSEVLLLSGFIVIY